MIYFPPISTIGEQSSRSNRKINPNYKCVYTPPLLPQLGSGLKINIKSWFGPKRYTKFTFNTNPPPTQTVMALIGNLGSWFPFSRLTQIEEI